MLIAGMIDLARALDRLSLRRPIFHSEADFQFALAWEIQSLSPNLKLRLERPLGNRGRLDIEIIGPSQRSGLELKYLVKPGLAEFGGESFHLRSRAADHARYDVVKDVLRLEGYVRDNPGASAAVVALASDPGMWKPPREGAATSSDAAFRIHDGAVLSGELVWGQTAGPGSVANRGKLSLRGTYALSWRDYAHEPLEMKVLVMPVG